MANPVEIAAQTLKDFAQTFDYELQHWTTANGLPANFVGDLYFDRNESLWLTTFGGLVNISGEQVKVHTKYNNSELDQEVFHRFHRSDTGDILVVGEHPVKIVNGEIESIEGFEGNEIFARLPVLQDESKTWISGEGGVCILDQLVLESCSEPDAYIVDGVLTEGGEHLFGSIGGGLKRYDAQSQSYHRLEIENAPEDTLLIYDTSWNEVLLTSMNTVYRLDLKTMEAEKILESTRLGFVNKEDSKADEVLLPTSSGLYIYSRKEGLSKVFDGTDLYKVKRDFYGRYWVSSQSGIYLLNRDFKEIDLPKDILPDGQVTDFELDSRGALWVSSETGLYRFTRKPILPLSSTDGLLEGMPWSIFPDASGGLVIGVYSGGISHLTTSGFENLSPGNGLGSVNPDIKPVIRDSKGQFWFGSHRNGGLFRRNVNGALRDFGPMIGSDGRYNILYEIGPNQILVGALGVGLFVIENEENVTEVLSPGGSSILTGLTLYVDKNELLLLGGSHGILELNLTELSTTQRDISGMPDGFVVTSILEDQEGALWLGSGGQGFAKSQGDAFHVATSADGLIDNKIWQIFESEAGYLWFSTDRGIGAFNKSEFERAIVQEEGSFKSYHFTEADGMLNAEGTGGSYPLGYKDQSGRFWFTGLGGVNILDPMVAEKIIDDYSIRVETINGKRLEDAGRVEIDEGVRNISIEMVANDFGESGSRIYRYRLRGYQDLWQESSSNPSPLQYFNLDPGEYSFEYELLNRSVVASSSITMVDIHLADKWVNSAWLKLLALFLTFGLLFILHRWDRNRRDKSQLVQLVKERTQELEEKNKLVSNQRNELEELHQMRLAFFENFTHEFRRSLSLILGPLVELGQEEEMSSEWRSQITNAALHANYLSDMVRKLVDTFTIESKAIKLNLANSDISRTLNSTVRLFEPLAIAKGIELISEDFREDKFVHDPNFVRMVINNLLSNAIKFTPANGKVQIRTSRDYANRKFKVVVSDTGPGIPDAQKDKIFERFVSINPDNPGNSSGMGLGLHLSKAIAKIHHGDISIFDASDGGSVFVLTIPLNLSLTKQDDHQGNFGEFEPIFGLRNFGDSNAILTPQKAESTPLKIDEKAIRVLLIEDDLEFLNYLKSSLTKLGFEILEAQNAEDALSILEKNTVDLVTTDILLPGMSGIEFIQEAQEDDLLKGVPVFVLSGKSDLDTRIAALDLGALEYVVKPIVAAELGARIRSLVSLRKQLKGNRAQPSPILMNELPESEDVEFYNSLIEAISLNLSNTEYNVSWMADDLAKGIRHLQRRTKFVTGMSPVELLKSCRIDAAKSIMDAGRKMAIAEIALKVGYKDRKRFSKHFRELIGTPPSKYIKNLKGVNSEAKD